MICPHCQKENASGSKFCMHCGMKLQSRKPAGERTGRKKLYADAVRILFYLAACCLALCVVSKVVYHEEVKYNYETSSGYWRMHSVKGPGEQSMYIRFYPVLKIPDWHFGSAYGRYENVSELDADFARVEADALDEYQENINIAILLSLLGTLVAYALNRYVAKSAGPKQARR